MYSIDRWNLRSSIQILYRYTAPRITESISISWKINEKIHQNKFVKLYTVHFHISPIFFQSSQFSQIFSRLKIPESSSIDCYTLRRTRCSYAKVCQTIEDLVWAICLRFRHTSGNVGQTQDITVEILTLLRWEPDRLDLWS